ncbi:MAG: hypothetical protein WA672_05395 [Candidatus Angelobacter sp.]
MSYILVALSFAALGWLFWLGINKIYALAEPPNTTASVKQTPTPTATPTPLSLDELAAAIAAKMPSPPYRSPERHTTPPTPITKAARIGTGPDAYKDINDAQVGQWAMEEADKISDMAKKCIDDMAAAASRHESIHGPQFFFTNDFKSCCAKDVIELRTEIFNRLGPPAKDPEEESNFSLLMMDLNDPRITRINPQAVYFYAPYLKKFGVRLKRREIPRAATKDLKFTEVSVQPEANYSYRILISIESEAIVRGGYIVVEFDGQPAAMACDFEGSAYLIDAKFIENQELKEYIEKRHQMRMYGITIGKNPLIHGKPIHVVASGVSSAPFHVRHVMLFDE